MWAFSVERNHMEVNMEKKIRIGNRYVGEGEKTYIVAEVSANHLQDYSRAEAIIRAAADAGADAVKLQTYTSDTITIDCDNEYFQITQGTIWDGTTLHKLYETAYTPWEWQPKLKKLAEELGMECFSSPFDATAVDFMQEMDQGICKCPDPTCGRTAIFRQFSKFNSHFLPCY